MDNVMQFLFNTNHEQPSILVWILLIVIAVVIPNYVRYRMEQKRHRLGQHGKDALLFYDLP